MTFGELWLCMRLGLVEPTPRRPGEYRLTRKGRILLGDLSGPESNDEWLARVERAKELQS